MTYYRVTRHVSSESKLSASERRPRSAEFSELTSLSARDVFKSTVSILGNEEEASEVLHLEHSFIWC